MLGLVVKKISLFYSLSANVDNFDSPLITFSLGHQIKLDHK